MATTKTVEIEVKAKDNASKTFNGIWESISKNLNKIKIASWAVSAWLVALWKKFLDASIENEPLQKSFERLSESAWIASKDMLDAMRKASQGTVADTQLMASANKAYALWIVNSAEDMATMIEVARLKGQAMWRTMEEALDDITTWLWRGSAQILDNLWIVIKAEEANEKYAESIWKTVKELTDAEKKQALVNAVIAQGREELANAWEVQLTMQERIAKLNASWENTKNIIWDALIPVLDKLLTNLTPIIEKVVAWIEENPELTANILLATTAVAWLTFAMTTLAPAITTAIELLSWPVWLLIAISAVIEALYMLSENTLTTQDQIVLYQQELENLRIAYENGTITMNEYIVRTKELNDKIALAEAKHRTLWWYLKDNFINTLRSIFHPMDENNGWLRAWIDLLSMLWDWLGKVADKITNVFVKAIDTAISRLKELWEWAQMLGEDISGTVSSAWKATTSWVSSKVQWFATGWEVRGNVPILVWERWPELFVPNTNWNIVPNEDLIGGAITINVNMGWVSVNNWWDEIALAEMVASTITRELELYKKGIY